MSLLEAVCFQPPEEPSRRVARRSGRIAAAKRIEGDLDAIVLKALRKEPEQRYASAAHFGAYLRRFLEAAANDAIDAWRNRKSRDVELGRFLGQDRRHRVGGGFSLERSHGA